MNHPNPQKYFEMEDDKITNSDNEYSIALSEQDFLNANNASATVPYTEYLALRQRFLKEKQKMEDQIWLDQALIRYSEVLKENAQKDITVFSEIILHHIAKLVNAVYGAFFMMDEAQQQIKAVAGYACTLDTMARTEFKIGEGLIGQVAKTKEIICLENIETQLDSSLGRISATTLIIAPMVINKKVLGILELNSLSKAEPRVVQLLEKISYHTALTLEQLLSPANEQQSIDAVAYHNILSQLSQKEEELKQLHAALAEKQSQTDSTKSNETTEQDVELLSTLEQTKQQLQEKEEQLQQLEAQLLSAQTQGSKGADTSQLESLEQAIAEIQEKLTAAQAEAQEKQLQLDSTQEKLNELLGTVNSENTELINALEAQLAQLNTQLDEINAQNEQFKQEIQRRGTDYDMLKETIKWKDAEIDRQDEVLLERKKALQNVEKERDLIQAENLKQIEEIVRQGKALKAKEAEIETLLAKVEEGVSSEQLTEIQNALIQKEQELAQIQLELQEKSTELENTTARLAALENELAQKNQEINELQQTIQNYNQQLEIQTEKLSGILTKLRKKEDELLVSQYLLNQQQSTGENAEIINSLRSQILSKEEEIKTLQAQIQAKEQHFNDTYQALQTHLEAQNNANIETLQAEIETLKQEQLNHPSQAETTQVLEEEIEVLKNEIVQKNSEIAHLKDQLETQQLIFEDNDLGSLQEKLAEKENEIRFMKESNQLQVEALEALKAELAQKEDTLEALHIHSEENLENEEFSQALQELQRKEQELLQQTEVLSNLRSQLLEKEKTIEQLKKQTQTTTEIDSEELVAFQQKLEDLELIHQDLKSKEEEIAKHTEVIRAQKGEILEKHQLLESLREEIKLKEQENRKQQDQIHSQQEQLMARQEELNQKERELTGLFNKINTAFAALEFDMNGHVLSMNNKFLMLLGRKIQEVEGELLDIILTDSFKKSMDYVLLWEGLKMGVTQTIEQFVCLANKEREIQMSVTFIPILDNQGRPYEIVLLVNQVYPELPTTTKPREQEPAQSATLSNDEVSQKLQAIDNHFILMELDAEGKIIEVNQQFMRCLGYDKKDVLGKVHKSILDVTDRTLSSYENTMKNLQKGGISSEILKYLGKEGERVRLKSHFNPMFDEAQTHTKTLVISQFLN